MPTLFYSHVESCHIKQHCWETCGSNYVQGALENVPGSINPYITNHSKIRPPENPPFNTSLDQTPLGSFFPSDTTFSNLTPMTDFLCKGKFKNKNQGNLKNFSYTYCIT
jgi:hypothetical protein